MADIIELSDYVKECGNCYHWNVYDFYCDNWEQTTYPNNKCLEFNHWLNHQFIINPKKEIKDEKTND